MSSPAVMIGPSCEPPEVADIRYAEILWSADCATTVLITILITLRPYLNYFNRWLNRNRTRVREEDETELTSTSTAKNFSYRVSES